MAGIGEDVANLLKGFNHDWVAGAKTTEEFGTGVLKGIAATSKQSTESRTASLFARIFLGNKAAGGVKDWMVHAAQASTANDISKAFGSITDDEFKAFQATDAGKMFTENREFYQKGFAHAGEQASKLAQEGKSQFGRTFTNAKGEFSFWKSGRVMARAAAPVAGVIAPFWAGSTAMAAINGAIPHPGISPSVMGPAAGQNWQ